MLQCLQSYAPVGDALLSGWGWVRLWWVVRFSAVGVGFGRGYLGGMGAGGVGILTGLWDTYVAACRCILIASAKLQHLFLSSKSDAS